MRKVVSILISVLILLVFASCSQEPAPVPVVREISLDSVIRTVITGKDFTLQATVVADKGADTTVTWSSSDESVASVDSKGKVSAEAEGTAFITATAGDKSAKCLVIVPIEVIDVELVAVDRPFAFVTKGGTIKLNAIVKPDDATYKDVKWTSSKLEFATVSKDGEVKAVAEGTAEISATVDGKTGKCVLVVLPEQIPVTSITLDRNDITVAKGSAVTLKATVTPNNATYYKVYWESSDEKVVTVNNGVLTGVGAGSATVTAKAGDKKTTCSVVVTEESVAVTYNANYDEGKTWSQIIPRDIATNLADLMFTRDGYIFTGWNTENDYTGDMFCDGERVTLSEGIVLYAQWVKKDVYRLDNDGTLSEGEGFASAVGEFPANVCLPKTIDGKQVKIIGDELFNNGDLRSWNQIKQIKIPDGVTQIGQKVFISAYELEWLYLPASLEGFNANSFSQNEKLHFKVDPDNAKFTAVNKGIILLSKDKTVFYSYPTCPEDLEIAEGIKEIGANAFCYMDIKSVKLPDSLEIIGDWAFYEADFKSLTIPKGVKKIGEAAFGYTQKLEKVEMVSGAKLESLGYNAFLESSVEEIVIARDVGTIADYAFYEAVELEKIEFKGNIDMIGSYAFGRVQWGSDGLVMIIRGTGKPSNMGHDVFDEGKIKAIRVPEELVDQYKNATEWNAQAQYIESL